MNEGIKYIEKYLNKISKNYNIVEIITTKDDEGTIFVIKIPPEVTSKQRTQIHSDVIKRCVNYCKMTNLINILEDTAIIIRR